MIPISDAHAHVSPKGIGAKKLAMKFKEVGGWFIVLVSLPPYHYGLSESYNDLIKSFRIHLSQCDIVRKEGVKVACILGIHPAFIDRLVKNYQNRKEDLLKYLDAALNELEVMLRAGLINGLGEFGRPHYRTIPESFSLNDYVLLRVLELSRDYNIPVHLHLEDSGVWSVISIARISSLIKGIIRRKIIFHHASVSTCLNALGREFSSTVLGRKAVIENLIKHLDNKELLSYVGVESDYIDDPRRPGVVMYPWEIAREISELLKLRPEVEDHVLRMLIDHVVKQYGANPP